MAECGHPAVYFDPLGKRFYMKNVTHMQTNGIVEVQTPQYFVEFCPNCGKRLLEEGVTIK